MTRTPLQSMYSRLKITPNPDTGLWVLSEPFVYYRVIKGGSEFIEIPVGFEFDGATIPRVLWVIGHPMQIDTLIGALVHDYIYGTKEYSRADADEIFNEVMELCEVNFLKRVLYYLGVRIFGFIRFNCYNGAT